MPRNRENEVISMVTSSLKRICSGGIRRRNIPRCKCHRSIHKFDIDTSSTCTREEGKNHEWLTHLENLVARSVSYPNGPLPKRNNESEKSMNGNFEKKRVSSSSTFVDDVSGSANGSASGNVNSIGKPHDVEIKLAPTFFNRYRHKCENVVSGSGSGSPADCEDDYASSKTQENTIPPLEIISETGLTRSIESPLEMANLLISDMEDYLWYQRNVNVNVNTSASASASASTDESQELYSIRADRSGIICIVTPNRMQHLRSLGRVSCSQCTKWVKGEKGLWWHCQKEHTLDHSQAIAIASSSSGVNALSIVVYCPSVPGLYKNECSDKSNENENGNDNDHDNAGGTTLNSSKIIYHRTDPYFDIVKGGDLELFISFLRNRKDDEYEDFNVAETQDKNGASALHWAAGCGHLHIVKFLIEQHECPPDEKQRGKRSFRDRTPLHWACRNGHLPIVKYLVEDCSVNMDAVTIDGTTGFCWSCWQGHKDVMSYLHLRGANTMTTNSFGCNATLWSAQSTRSGLNEIKWLESIGLDLYLVNSNGHGILHKSAQRGKMDVCRWIIEACQSRWRECNGESTSSTSKTRHLEDESSFEVLNQIGPDTEGHCPSDLAGMEGFDLLANWLVVEERRIGMEACIVHPASSLPSWLRDGIQNSKHNINTFGLDSVFEKGAGVKKICAYISQTGHKRCRNE